jgi:hypothetical protein
MFHPVGMMKPGVGCRSVHRGAVNEPKSMTERESDRCLRRGQNRERYLGVKVPPTNLKPDYLEQARALATGLAGGLRGGGRSGSELSPRGAERLTDRHDEGEHK